VSTLVGEEHSSRIGSEEELVQYFQSHAKKREQMVIGIEAEFFCVFKDTGKSVPYHGPVGIHEILKALSRKFKYEPLLEGDNIIALKRGTNLISLEPGGQMELSAPPVSDVFKIEEQIKAFQKELKEIQTDFFPNVTWLAVGIQPFSTLDEIAWVPKHRYEIMAEYLKSRGTLSHHMMKRTATNHINVDYTSEENGMSNLRVALALTSIVSALFANSSFSLGKPNGFISERIQIWNHTDPDRTGLIPEFLQPGKTFKDYLKYVLDMPMIFIVRNGRWIPMKGIRFRDYLKKGFEGNQATIGDFEVHLSCAFPEARIKQYLEVRGVDCQEPYLITSVAAFWKGILYDPKARDGAWELVSFAKPQDFVELHKDIAKEGMNAMLAGKSIKPIACDLVDLSCSSLAKQKVRKEDESECIFLERIREKISRCKKSPAETFLEKWDGELNHDPKKVIEYLSII
jgi:glutamate--cysteine ligase